MFTFNQLLVHRGLDVAQVRLLRHRDPAPATQRLLYEAALTGDPRFERYQESQGSAPVIEQFRAAGYLASFVVDPTTKETVFAGIWQRRGERDTPPTNPFRATPEPETNANFDTVLLDAFVEYRGRIVIDWGDGTRAWVQRADRRDKPIVELRRVRRDPDFPGYLDLRVPLADVAGLPIAWTTALRNARGVYLLVHEKGEQYVGSACGDDGFFGRWRAYADGHGGNLGMRELAAAAEAYTASILEVAGSSASDTEVLAREAVWKAKLGSRAKGLGLNRN